MSELRIRGARTHNLRDLDLDLPRDALVVITGPSGSGKSSLAFDTIFAEGQRRYVESLSLRARQWMAQIPAPEVDLVEGLSPAIALEQETGGASPRSTVGTVSEVWDFLRILWAKLGVAHDPQTGEPLGGMTREGIVDALLDLPERTRFSILAPIASAEAGDHAALLDDMRRRGFVRVDIDGAMHELAELEGGLEPDRPHDIGVYVDRLVRKEGIRARLAESLETALTLAEGRVEILVREGPTLRFRTGGAEGPALTPTLFSFNTPEGACPGCEGLGTRSGSEDEAPEPCPECGGTRLGPYARAVQVRGRSITTLAGLALDDLTEQLRSVGEGWQEEGELVAQLLGRARARIEALRELGLGYLGLDRPVGSLSAGERQRLRLGTQIGAPLTGITYVLDEPSVGLHPSDTGKLVAQLRALRARGNMVLVVEHDPGVIRAADRLVDLGPGAGAQGGQIVAQGTVDEVLAGGGATADFLTGRRRIELSRERSQRAPEATLRILGARGHNLRGEDIEFPIGRLCCVTGVSGSGKSTLVVDTLLREASHRLNKAKGRGLVHDYIEGLEHFERVVSVDQAPIGRTPRSNPATYTKVFGELRKLYAKTKDARMRGWTASRFSFNRAGGRCETCQGEGQQRVELQFLPDAWIPCPVCRGARYERETLEVRFRGKNIAEALALDVEAACELFANQPRIRRPLEVMRDVGLGYLGLGQPAATLSGGEAQRIKLARELARARPDAAPTLFILDEPSSGLHFVDIELLLQVLDRLVDRGHTVVLISHDLDLVRNADHVVELGPGAGPRGGALVHAGPADELAKADTPTGRALRSRP